MKKNFDFKKIVLMVLIQIVCGIFLFAEDVAEEKTLTVKITNVASEDGQIILAIYNSSVIMTAKEFQENLRSINFL